MKDIYISLTVKYHLFFPSTDSQLVLSVPQHFENSMRFAKARENNTE